MIKTVKENKIDVINNVLLPVFLIALLFSTYSIYAFLFTKIDFLEDFLYNNLSYAIGSDQKFSSFVRISGSFLEPSMSGSFFVAYSIAFLYYSQKTIANVLFFIVALFFLVLSTSSTAYLSFIIITFIMFVAGLLRILFRQKFRPDLVIIYKFLIPILAICIIAIIFSEEFFAIIDFVLYSKSDSDSFLHRQFADAFALNILFETYGLGSGLGSNRPSSFLFFIISNMGIIGLILFSVFFYKIYSLAYKYINFKEIRFILMLLTSILLTMMIAIPDISYSFLWLFSALLVGTSLKKRRELNNAIH